MLDALKAVSQSKGVENSNAASQIHVADRAVRLNPWKAPARGVHAVGRRSAIAVGVSNGGAKH